MSNILYILSIIIASIWFVGYVMWDAPVMIHSLIVFSFFGILASVLMDRSGQTSNK